MSLPAFFTPVRDGEHVYVDGGLLDNLPVDVARSMGAEIVIAVHLETKPVNPSDAVSSLGVLQRSLSVNIALNELRSMEKADVVLTADVSKYDIGDFDRFSTIEEAGYKAAQQKSALLSTLRVSENEWQELLAERAARRRQLPVPAFVEVHGTSENIAKGLQHKLESNVGQPLDPDSLDKQMMSITGLGRFSRAGYQIMQRDGQAGLRIQADEKEYAPPTVHPLLLIDGSDFKDVLFQVGARITFLDFGGYGSEWRNDLVAGSEYGLSTEYYHPFTPYTHWFVASQAIADSAPFNVYQRDRVLAQYRNRKVGASVDLGYVLGKTSELRLGYGVGFQKLSEELGSPVVPSVRGRVGVATVRYRLDNFDSPVIPRNGLRMESTFKYYDANPGAQNGVPTEELRFGVAQQTSIRGSFLFFASGGTAFSARHVGFPPFSLGGPLRIGAYGTNELLTSQYFLFQPAYLYRLRELSPLLGQNVYLFSGYEIGKAYGQPPGVSKLPQNGTLGVLLQTVFGPIFFGGSIGDSGHRRFYFKVGKFF
jgi:NTE family protein